MAQEPRIGIAHIKPQTDRLAGQGLQLARLYLRHVQDISKRLARAFPDQFKAVRHTIDADIGKMQAM